MKGYQDEYSLGYYKDQLVKVNELNEMLQKKVKKLQAEVKKLQVELGKIDYKPVDSHAELEYRIV